MIYGYKGSKAQLDEREKAMGRADNELVIAGIVLFIALGIVAFKLFTIGILP